MTTEQQTTAQILKVSDATGKNGPQWELKVKWPWHPAGNKYGDSIWIDVNDFPEKPSIGVHSVVALKGTVKKKQDGGYHDGSQDWMYNFDILSFNGSARPADDYQDPRAQEPRTERPNTGIVVEGVVQGHLEKLATDLYNAERDISEPIDYLRIRKIRDAFFHLVKEVPIAPEHWCYEHQAARRATKSGSYVHQLGDQWCSEDGLYDTRGQPVTEEPKTIDHLPF